MRISKVLNFVTAPYPFFALLFLVFNRMEAREHAIVEEGVGFPEVDNIKLDIFIGRQVNHPKVKPLSITLGIDIILQE